MMTADGSRPAADGSRAGSGPCRAVAHQQARRRSVARPYRLACLGGYSVVVSQGGCPAQQRPPVVSVVLCLCRARTVPRQ